MSIRILGIAGSTRRESLNRRLLHVAMRGAESAELIDVQIEDLDLRDLDIPLYDNEIEAVEGMPDGVRRLREALKSSDGVIVASPEYNGSMTAVLKTPSTGPAVPTRDSPTTRP
jgi:chromate reductase